MFRLLGLSMVVIALDVALAAAQPSAPGSSPSTGAASSTGAQAAPQLFSQSWSVTMRPLNHPGDVSDSYDVRPAVVQSSGNDFVTLTQYTPPPQNISPPQYTPPPAYFPPTQAPSPGGSAANGPSFGPSQPGMYSTTYVPGAAAVPVVTPAPAIDPPSYEPYKPPRGGWLGGATIYVLRPQWTNGNTAYLQWYTNSGGLLNKQATQFDYGFNAAPGFWAAKVNDAGFGVRGEAMRFDQTATAVITNPGGQTISDPFSFGNSGPDTYSRTAGQVFNAHSRLQLTSFDLEVAKYSLLDQWTWNVGGGLRYVWMYQSYTAALSSADSFFNFVVASRKLNAFGPTMSGQVRHRLGASNCGFFAGGRGALLFGYQRQTVTATLNNLNSTNNMSDWSVMPFVQAECGFDYRLPLSTSTFVAETALLGQAWINAGNSSNTNATDGTATDATLGLFGIRSSVGLTY